MLLVEVRRLEIAPTNDQFWTIVSRVNGPEFMGVLYRAREAIFDSAGISFTIDLLNKFLQFDVTKSWSAADEGELFMGQAPVVGWLRVRRPGSATLRELRSDDIHFMELEHAAKPAFVEVGVAYRAGTEKVRTDFLKRIRTATQEVLGQEVATRRNRPAKGLCRLAVLDPLDQLVDECVPGAGRNALVYSLISQNLHAALQQGGHDQDAGAFARLVQAMLVERQFGAPSHLEGHPLFRSEKPDARLDRTCPITQRIGEQHAEHDPGGMVFLPSILPPPLIQGQQDGQGQKRQGQSGEIARFAVPSGGGHDHGDDLAPRAPFGRLNRLVDFSKIFV